MNKTKSFRNAAVLASWVCVMAQTTLGTPLYWTGATNNSLLTAENWTPAQVPASGDFLYWNGQQAGDLNLTYGSGVAVGGVNGVRLYLTAAQTGNVNISLVDTLPRVFRLAAASSILDSGSGALTLEGQDATVRAVFELGNATTGQTVTFNNNSANTATFGQYTTIRKHKDASNQSITFRGSGTVRILGQINHLGSAGSVSVRTGTLLLEGTMVHSGNVDAESGLMEFTSAAAIGATGNRIKLGQGELSGTLKYSGSEDVVISRQVAIGIGAAVEQVGNGTIDASGAGKLVFSNANFNVNSTQSTAITRTLTLAGSSMADNEIQGVIINNASNTASVAIAKSGGGKWILSGTNTYSGATTVSGGTLVGKNGAFAGSSGIAVSDDATLVLNGAATLGTNATLALGTSAALVLDFEGTQQVGALSLNGGSTWLDDGTYSATQLAALNASGTYSGAGLIRIGDEPVYIGEVSFQLLPGNTSLVLGWESVNGAHYGVETTTDLVYMPWTPVQTNILGNGSFLSFTGSVSEVNAFFRIVLE